MDEHEEIVFVVPDKEMVFVPREKGDCQSR